MFDFATFPVLTTARLTLRQIVPTDAPAIAALFGSPEVMRYLSFDPIDTIEKAEGFISWLADGYHHQGGVDWAIVHHESQHVIGMCGLAGWERDDRKTDLGYHVLPKLWGQGYATEAVRAIVRWGFDALDLHRIQADCTAGNLASERVLIKCGFTYEGLRREDVWEHGQFVDSKLFGLLRREFEALKDA